MHQFWSEAVENVDHSPLCGLLLGALLSTGHEQFYAS